MDEYSKRPKKAQMEWSQKTGLVAGRRFGHDLTPWWPSPWWFKFARGEYRLDVVSPGVEL